MTMAQNFKLSTGNYLEWTTEKPYEDCPRQSPSFSFLGHDWYFRLEYNNYSYKLFLEYRMDENYLLASDVKIQAMITQNNVLILHQSSTVTAHTTTLISFYDSKFKYRNSPTGQWTIGCIFLTDLPSKLQIHGSETMKLPNLSNLDTQAPSILMEAELAACSPGDSLFGLECMSLDFSKLLAENSTADVTLRCGDRTFSAHRNILGARSKVFEAMFRNRMVESETGIIDITDIDGDVLDLLLQYVYSGKISDLSVDVVSSLYKAADKYAIHSLKNECSKWMLENLSNENCLDFLFLAEDYGDERFKDRVVNFTAKILAVLKEESWVKFIQEYPKLAFNVLQRLSFINKQN